MALVLKLALVFLLVMMFSLVLVLSMPLLSVFSVIRLALLMSGGASASLMMRL